MRRRRHVTDGRPVSERNGSTGHPVTSRVILCDPNFERVGQVLEALSAFEVLYCNTLEDAAWLCHKHTPEAVVMPLHFSDSQQNGELSDDVAKFLGKYGQQLTVVAYGKAQQLPAKKRRQALVGGAANVVDEASAHFGDDLRTTLNNELSHWQERGACQAARDYCSPEYVFEKAGQDNFCLALRHFASCVKAPCVARQEVVQEAMQKKLLRMWTRGKRLGCPAGLPHFYDEQTVIFSPDLFRPATAHLAACLDPSCAQLRRALLLTIREACSVHADQKPSCWYA